VASGAPLPDLQNTHELFYHRLNMELDLQSLFRLLCTAVGIFRQKNNSAEDGIGGINGYFRRNSDSSAEQKFSEFRSEPFRGREYNSEFRTVKLK
jgi:hypothetical protein